MEVEFDVKMTTSALYDYNMHHTYTSASGVIGTMVGILLLVGYTRDTSFLALLVAGLVILFYSPVTLFTRSKKQILLNPAFKNPLHYKMTDEGVTVSNGEEAMTVEWKDMYKAYSTNQSIILATGKNHAWIFPKKVLGENKSSVIRMISTHMSPELIRIKQ